MATLRDVANKAGVAPITVSRVINHNEYVKEETRNRVQKVMAEMHYIPNVAARNLITKKSHIINVYIPNDLDLSNPFMMQFIAGISEVLSVKMYSFLILRNRKNENICDGYIVTGLIKNEVAGFERYASERERPIALFGHTDLKDIDCIDVDNVLGAYKAVNYLIHKGHTKIAMINVDEDKDYVADRQEGYRKALEEAGLKYKSENVFFSKNHQKDGYEIAKQLLTTGKYSAIFCATDTMAIGVENAITEAGLKVPDDISIIGFDGLGHHLLASPRIATIQQPVFEIGRRLANILVEKIEGKKQRTTLLIEPELIEGESVRDVKCTAS